MLDLACGDGHMLSLLANLPAPHTLLGIDLSDGELAAAHARLGDRAILCRCKAQQLPLASASVDAVLSHLALMLMHDADELIAEVRRVMRPGGTFVGLVGALSPPNAALDAFIRLYPGDSRQPVYAGIRFGDRRFGSEDGIRTLLVPGFDILTFDELSLSRDYTPAEAWNWLRHLYDTDLLRTDALEVFRRECLQALQSLCEQSGTLCYEDRWLRFSASVR